MRGFPLHEMPNVRRHRMSASSFLFLSLPFKLLFLLSLDLGIDLGAFARLVAMASGLYDTTD